MSEDDKTADEAHVDIVRAHERLVDVRAKLASVTGGASPRAVLAEVAQALAADLAAHFDELPMHAFDAYISRGTGVLSYFRPAKKARHRVVMGRYLKATIPRRVAGTSTTVGSTVSWTQQWAMVAILALGSDGVLRVGKWNGMVNISSEMEEPTLTPMAWDDIRLTRIPPGAVRVTSWKGSPEPADVADPSRVLQALTAIASKVAAESEKELALLKRFL